MARQAHAERLRELLRQFPVVGLVGPRQVGKTTIARTIAEKDSSGATFFDLEDPSDRARIADPMLALSELAPLRKPLKTPRAPLQSAVAASRKTRKNARSTEEE